MREREGEEREKYRHVSKGCDCVDINLTPIAHEHVNLAVALLNSSNRLGFARVNEDRLVLDLERERTRDEKEVGMSLSLYLNIVDAEAVEVYDKRVTCRS